MYKQSFQPYGIQDAGYFLPEHYVPESLLRGRQAMHLTEELQKSHSALTGLLYSVAQTRFISLIQDSQHYGTHYYHVTQVRRVKYLDVLFYAVTLLA